MSNLSSLLKGMCYFIYLVFLALFFNVVQLLSVFIYPFSSQSFRKINSACAWFWWENVVFIMRKIQRIKVEFTGDSIPKNEHAMIISNHQSMIDIPAILCFVSKEKRLFDLKWFVKDILKYVPILGWGMKFLNFVFLKRDWIKDQKKIKKTFQHITENKIPIWLISFVEGTRISKDKVKKCQEFCRKTNKPVFNHVLLPKTKGFVSTINGLQERLDAVYDLTIGYPQKIPNITQLFTGGCMNIHLHIRRFPMSKVPSCPKKAQIWLWHRFGEKDELLKFFNKAYHFPKTEVSP